MRKAETREAEQDVFGTDSIYNEQWKPIVTNLRFPYLHLFPDIKITDSLYNGDPLINRRFHLASNTSAHKELNITF